MTWTALSISPPAGTAAEILAAMPAGRLLAVAVDPWQSDIRQGSGHHSFLSFPNAIEALIVRLGDWAGSVLAVGVAARDLAGLEEDLTALALAFPMPHFERARRRARVLRTLEDDKFELPALGDNGGPVGVSPLAFPALRGIAGASRRVASADAAGGLPDNPLSSLDDLQALKTAHDAAVAGALDAAKLGLAGGAGWRCFAESDAAAALRLGGPGHDYPLSVIFAFLGSAEDLALLAEILA